MAFWSKKPKDAGPDQEASKAPPLPNGAGANGASMPIQSSTGAAVGSPGAPATTTSAATPLPPPAPAAQGQPSSAPTPATLDPAEAQKRAAASKQMLLSFGSIVSVLMRSDPFKRIPLQEVEALVVPAVSTGQFLLAEAQSKTNGFISPVAVVMWATVSEQVDARLAANPQTAIQLAPDDWRSGSIPWLIAMAGDPRMTNSMLKQLHETIVKRPIKMRVMGANQMPAIAEYPPVRAPDAAPQRA